MHIYMYMIYVIYERSFKEENILISIFASTLVGMRGSLSMMLIWRKEPVK